MDSLMNTGKANPRGIPEAPFLENVQDFIKDASDFDLLFTKFQERLSMYKYMQESKLRNIKSLKSLIPDIENTLKLCRRLQSCEKPLETSYQLNDTLFTKAAVQTGSDLKVGLWLGADVMLEYPVQEAIDLLITRLSDANKSLTVSNEDVEFLRENITTMEVNCARLYNWDVERRQAVKKAENDTKNMKI